MHNKQCHLVVFEVSCQLKKQYKLTYQFHRKFLQMLSAIFEQLQAGGGAWFPAALICAYNCNRMRELKTQLRVVTQSLC